MINLDDPKVCKIKKTEDLMHYELSIKCPRCGEWHTVTVKSEQLFALRQTGSINCLVGTHNADDREIVKTGICTKCWNEVFGL